MSLVYIIKFALHIIRKLLFLWIHYIRECYLLIIFIRYFKVLRICIVLFRVFDWCWIRYFNRFIIYLLVYNLKIMIFDELYIFIFIILVLVFEWFNLYFHNALINYIKSINCIRMILSEFSTYSCWIKAHAVPLSLFFISIKFHFAQIQIWWLILFMISIVIIFFFYFSIIFIFFILSLDRNL